MLVVGLTGSIGMGKSTAARRLQHHGLPVFDADAVVHDLYAGAAAPLIEQAFPGATRDGVVDRQTLSTLLDGDRARFEMLEGIVHPLVRDAEQMFLRDVAAAGGRASVLEVPLLYETGLDQQVDAVIVVSAPRDMQRARVLGRPGMTEAKFASIVALQMPDEEKRQRADFVVDTSGSIEESQAQIDDIIPQLMAMPAHAYDRHWA